MGELPFIPFTESLKDVLRKNFIRNCSIWLLGKDESSLLAQVSNSNWETALSIIFLTKTREILMENKEEKSLCGNIESKNASAARWLLSKKIVLDAEHVSWDRGTWDTAVVIRALLATTKNYPEKFSEEEKREINETILKATRWLFKRFKKWEKEVKFPFGPCDVAQILITIIYIKEQFPELSEKIFNSTEDITVPIVDYLLRIKDEVIEKDETLSYWIDFFNSAEVIESLAIFYNYCKQNGTLLSQLNRLLEEIELVCKQTCRYFENGQIDGRWGTHADTCRVLYSYVKTAALMPIVTPESHLVFKALRWICDEKQFFPDGSFLHTMFITIFFYPALLQLYENWPLSNRKVQEIYDDIVWVSPMRTSPERSARLSAELKNRELKRLNKEHGCTISNLKKTMSRRRRNLIKSLVTSFFLMGVLLVFLTSGNLLNIFFFDFKFGVDPAANIKDFFSYLTIWIVISSGVIGLIWNYERIFK